MKNVFGLLAIVLVMIVSVAVIMGDDWRPFVAEVRQSCKEQMFSLIDRVELERRQAMQESPSGGKSGGRAPGQATARQGTARQPPQERKRVSAL